MSFPRYPKYKASGVGWFGDVPEHWSTVRYKNVFTEKRSVSGAALPSGSISFGRVIFKSDKVLNELTKATYQEVLAGEFLINPINLNYDLKSLRTGLSDIDTCVSPAYIVLRSGPLADKCYLKYQLHVFDVSHMKTLGAGVRQTITFGDIGTCPTYIPPLPEQTAIAEFLDRETGKIDELVAEQRRLMELLKEKRQAVISHAVTKGLNPHAPMKPSGIEWLGDVPVGWEVIPLRRIVAEHRQGYYSTDPYVDSGVKLLRITDLRESGTVDYDSCPRVEDRRDVDEFILRTGDFVFARTGGAGSFGLIGEISERIAYASYLIRFRLYSNALPRFMRFFFLSAHFKGGIQRDIHGGVNQNVHAQDIKNQCFALPPINDQNQIADFLETELAKFDTLTAEAQRAIDLLQERRTALISAAVTGQIDVRQPLKN
jgi:type I restriction enzyme S subunit